MKFVETCATNQNQIRSYRNQRECECVDIQRPRKVQIEATDLQAEFVVGGWDRQTELHDQAYGNVKAHCTEELRSLLSWGHSNKGR